MMFGNYLFNLRPGVLIKTLSHILGKLNLPTLLFRVGLLIILIILYYINCVILINIINNPTLNNNVDKFNLPHVWDWVLINTPGLKLNK